jgi:hypothetical protein
MEALEIPGYGEVISFTTLHSPPSGFASPLHLALVELDEGARLLCHGAGTRGLRLGSHVTIEAVDGIYYFSAMSLAERAALFLARRGGRATERLVAFAKSAAKRVLRPPGAAS